MKNWPFRIGFVVLGIIIAVAWWFYYRSATPPAIEVPPIPVVQPAPKPAIQHPVEDTPVAAEEAAPVLDREQPLPELKASDARITEILGKLFAGKNLDRFLVLDHFIERFVVMVDSLPRSQVPKTHRPIKPIPERFLAQGERDQLTIDPANYQRYVPLVTMLGALDTRQVVAVYKRLYPLFQEAYEKLGYPEAYFNDRLIEVIDHLLQTPQVADPVALIQPKALYLYADPNLENLSAGRKILIRSGPENAIRIKSILRDYRRALVAAD
ncbi:MAG: DUF3014 domain-containing protein [Desulfuromonadales bacterium]|jgi:hypothetical protein